MPADISLETRMSNLSSFKAHLVRVTTDSLEHQLWLATTARHEAVSNVLQAIPEGWTAVLLAQQLGAGQAGITKLEAGAVCELWPNHRPARARLN